MALPVRCWRCLPWLRLVRKNTRPNGWLAVPNGCERYTDAMYRHLLAEATGQQCDAESGLAHAAHAAWCAMARLELMLRDEEAWKCG